MIPKERQPRYSSGFYLPGPEHILTLPGQVYSQMPSASHGRTIHLTQVPRRDTGVRVPPADSDGDPYRPLSAFDIVNDVFIADESELEEVQREKQKRKKQKQWKKWTQDVIPSLLRPHLRLLRKSVSLCSVPRHTEHRCSCNGASSRRLKVVCVSFEREFYVF
jgi:hypothetical protein